MAELTGLGVKPARAPSVEELAGKAFMEVEALVALGTPVPEVELAQLPHLGRLSVVRVDTLLGCLLTLALHEHLADPLALSFPPFSLPFFIFP